MSFQLQKDVKVEYDPKGMPFRRLGPSGLRVPLFSLGGWLTLGGSVKGDPVKEIMKTAFDNGINMFDTAETYADGKSEEEMGRVIKELGLRRTDIIVTTKIFWGVGRKDPNAGGLSRKHILEGTQESLARLQLDYVDIIFAHRADPNVPMEEVVRAFNFVIEKGWALYWATSEWTAVEIEEAHHIATKLGLIAPVADQCQHNMFTRERPEKEYAPLYQKYNYGTTTFSSLYFGLLTGKYNDGIPPDSRFALESDFVEMAKELQEEKGKDMIRKVKELTVIAEKELNTTISALALAWVARHPNTSTVILGASKPEQVLENLKALDVVPKLTDEMLDRIDAILGNKPAPLETNGRPPLDAFGQFGPKARRL
ncbi:voltage-gated potassium channel beta-2 subunit [Gymnopus androsaceus JB14]|uniref:Voltage-gated potassium channel beta-2 subunit n=1 Tax=Gymnopus androsaceus JB14 TaxID=1447944 RepID=A0A6A4HD72_9AGAR|nr:voltage-gated potassium channel beta-2 subunit [Gymnopus androsaceus JB14]